LLSRGYEALTELLRNGLSAGWLTPEILYGNDQSVLQVFKEHQGESPHLRLFNEPFSIHSTESPGDTLYRVKKGKIRYFDPPVLIHNESRLLSEVDSEYKRQLTFRISSFEARRHGEAFSVKFTPSASTSST
jgi:hypothetical protein